MIPRIFFVLMYKKKCCCLVGSHIQNSPYDLVPFRQKSWRLFSKLFWKKIFFLKINIISKVILEKAFNLIMDRIKKVPSHFSKAKRFWSLFFPLCHLTTYFITICKIKVNFFLKKRIVVLITIFSQILRDQSYNFFSLLIQSEFKNYDTQGGYYFKVCTTLLNEIFCKWIHLLILTNLEIM